MRPQDKNASPDAKAKFQRLAQAYEVPFPHPHLQAVWPEQQQPLLCAEAHGKRPRHRRASTRLAPKALAHAQVLSDARLRRAYDYALEHPEELMYNRMRFYNAHAYKYWQTDARAVVLGFIVLVSGVQYMNQHFVYQSVRPPHCLGPARWVSSIRNLAASLVGWLQWL